MAYRAARGFQLPHRSAKLGAPMISCADMCARLAAIGMAAALGATLGGGDISPAAERCPMDAESAGLARPPVLTALRTRDREVTVYAGETLHFTVVDGRGLVLGEWLDRDAFAHRFPDLADHFATAFAEEHWLDASANVGEATMTQYDRDPLTGAWPRRGTADGRP